MGNAQGTSSLHVTAQQRTLTGVQQIAQTEPRAVSGHFPQHKVGFEVVKAHNQRVTELKVGFGVAAGDRPQRLAEAPAQQYECGQSEQNDTVQHHPLQPHHSERCACDGIGRCDHIEHQQQLQEEAERQSGREEQIESEAKARPVRTPEPSNNTQHTRIPTQTNRQRMRN
jgi:hypothetical protein